MTPFGEEMVRLRAERGVTQKQMAQALNVSAAYLSALEHGRRGTPSFDFLQRVAGYFHIIWDEADALFALAAQSNPRVTVDTSGLPAAHTILANRLAARIRHLPDQTVVDITQLLDNAQKGAKDGA
ncbi:helix-turn-helix domain-containing protein [Rhizobium sp. DKSPLA3]|uniref:Helix-turn-helix domain-containing protein n=1 Tax=Rhizobium quercicola TaxID=2901226 RepID=A0A9X1NPR6_9HYPH|nr:helix-turn-helix domain-containing protein [Rhizobium quercicola]MCD7108158.1 helix-turn-helix domain-containing protein [Rhizobium quercicola]